MEGLTDYGALVAAILILVKVLRDEQLRRYEKKKNCNPTSNTSQIPVLKSEIGTLKTGQALCHSQLRELCEASVKANFYLEQILDEVKKLKP